ncbi:glycosyl transferase group 1 [Desulfofundulus kuznetsovii DSM 6115]|uniref:Glycosyl transferase group 1 n=1 Tax=Desulfofundulus kuznetsovii (strain DSM 6115 / VKM B-1805 / 17) TaxID=760568 RepID=A0AAU8PNV8_DESK7|nr:glycosyl transferase group 1 [Desulfofundulus kuznetsovii DSM 6115]
MLSLRVVMQSRVSLFNVPGGDTIQILKTKEYLEKLGVKCDISLDLEPELSPYDLVHLFNLTRPQEVYLQALNAKKQGKPVVLSPIYVLYTEYDRSARPWPLRLVAKLLSPSQFEYMKICARSLRNGEYHRGTKMVLRYGYGPLLKRILALCDFLLPNSYSEMRRIERDLGVAGKLFLVVPNAADHNLFDPARIQLSGKWEHLRNCVLCVARIEGRKNQLKLVEAVRGGPYRLVLVGEPAPNHRRYAEAVRRSAPPNVIFLGKVPHEELPELYHLAKVHVLASWMETTGLSSLEAGMMGCNLVITDKGDTREYFGDYAYYCDPASVDSIREAIDRAWHEPANPNLREHILRNFTWEKAAEITLTAYQRVLGQT